ncbi:uncharacterized protein G2W53_031423 [Senna tora]|uniref:Uncharacterized protein n=1 Tax=Senna tora TaxID=362788 RepID=A0A834THF0_9FABA|nr:uncharacterized protein G2W53_031423 [Senna tora]
MAWKVETQTGDAGTLFRKCQVYGTTEYILNAKERANLSEEGLRQMAGMMALG